MRLIISPGLLTLVIEKLPEHVLIKAKARWGISLMEKRELPFSGDGRGVADLLQRKPPGATPSFKLRIPSFIFPKLWELS